MNEFRDRYVIRALLGEIERKAAPLPRPIRLMEVCGTHTMTIHRFGLKGMLEAAGITMVSGPGCPVCITPDEFHTAAIGLVEGRPNLILATFGDMTRVPTERGSIQTAVPAAGSRVRIVYSPEESLEEAARNPGCQVVFFGVGFETTIPSIALTVRRAAEAGLDNFSVLSALWIIPPPLRALCADRDIRIQGFLYPGHVSAIIGLEPYRFIPEEFGLAGSVAGFEPVDILLAVSGILDQITSGRPEVANEYSRVVRPEGNPAARRVMDSLLEPRDAFWRGLGSIPRSGLRLKEEHAAFDAERKFDIRIEAGGRDLPGCRCGDVLKGKIQPPECGLFGKACRPDSPQGPCMVSFEGSCLAHFKYGVRPR